MDALFPPTIQERFEDFDRKHPEVFVAFLEIAEQLLASGHRHYSADAIMHVVRFHRDVNRSRDGGFKINDHFVSRYARKLMTADARFAGFFTTRTLHG
jgi:hypothetical protein